MSSFSGGRRFLAEQIDETQKRWICAKILEFFPDVEILAFGSRIRGTAKPYSDLDLALRTSANLNFSDLRRLEEAFSESTIPFKIDLIDFSRVSPDFQKIILSTSVRWA